MTIHVTLVCVAMVTTIICILQAECVDHFLEFLLDLHVLLLSLSTRFHPLPAVEGELEAKLAAVYIAGHGGDNPDLLAKVETLHEVTHAQALTSRDWPGYGAGVCVLMIAHLHYHSNGQLLRQKCAKESLRATMCPSLTVSKWSKERPRSLLPL